MENEKKFNPFYNIEEIRAIPIEDVCKANGIEIVTKSGGSWCCVRSEKSASCKIYEGNTFCDFGNANRGGDVIDFYCYITDLNPKDKADRTKAIYALAEQFDIKPINCCKSGKGKQLKLTAQEYERIGICADLTTKNMNENIWNNNAFANAVGLPLLQNPHLLGECKALQKELERAERILKRAIEGCKDVSFTAGKYDIA